MDELSLMSDDVKSETYKSYAVMVVEDPVMDTSDAVMVVSDVTSDNIHPKTDEFDAMMSVDDLVMDISI